MADKKRDLLIDPDEINAILGAGPAETSGPDYDQWGDDFLNGIYSGDGFDDPKRPGKRIYKGGFSAGGRKLTGNSAISYVQKLLVKAGLLDPDEITHPGSPSDPATRTAMAALYDAQKQLGTSNVLETVEALSSQFPGWDSLKRTKERARFMAPEKHEESAQDVRSTVRTIAKEIKGEDASEEEVNQILLKVREAEQAQYQQEYDSQLAETNAVNADQDLGTRTITERPSTSTLAEESFMRSEEGLQWSVMKGIAGLINMMKSGG